ncbi:hypothetical protein RCL1_005674 [Eukaryota sp. TZLM3-RCL]
MLLQQSYASTSSFNKLRTNFLASLLEVDPLVLKNHIFCSPDLGGVGFTSSKYLTKAAFLGGAKNFVFEFSKRYANRLSLLSNTNSEYLTAVRNEISNLPPRIWAACFSSDLTDIPSRDISSLAGAYKKLQNRLVRFYEDMDSTVRISLAKYGNPSFGNFLMDLKNSSASVLFTQIPQVYGLLLNDHQWTTTMRLRCFLWPNNLPHDLVCKCSKLLTFHHLLNCKHFITYRSILHDAVRDQLHAMCKSYKLESFVEPVLRKLSVNVDDDVFGHRRADLIVPSSDGKFHVIDVVTVDVCKATAVNNSLNETSPLDVAENRKRSKYKEPLSQLGTLKHVKYELCPFALSLYGTLGSAALSFLNDFKHIVKKRLNKCFDDVTWTNRLVFTIFKQVPIIISKSLEALSISLDLQAGIRFDESDICFDDIDF